MTVNVAINGFGRIGRNILRAIVESGRNDIRVVAVNDLGPVETNAHLLRYDSIHGRFPGQVKVDGDTIDVGTGPIKVTALRDPAELPHKAMGVDIALECTGLFTSKEKASAHLKAGARRVLVSAPAENADLTVVFGVNHDKLNRDHMVVSNASCTTNCLAPLVKILNDSIGIEHGFMTTIHSYTGDQPTLDTMHKDLYRARAAALSMIPTSTGAAKAVGLVLPELQGKLDILDKLYIKSPTTGQQVPLATIASWTSVPVRPLSISHQGQFPAITISFNLAQGVALGQATTAVQKAMSDLGAPATLNSSFQGTAQAFQQSLGTVPLLILAALVVVYLILGILYESYIHPLTILSTLPSAGVGALATLMLFHFDFSLIALIGVILLIGIVKKNGIMLVDFAIVAERDDHLSAHDAVRRAALLRFRPIMMTTMAAMLGGVPLMLGQGTGSEIRQPLGYAMVGGLLVSQALTLFTTPVIYLYLDRVSDWVSSWRSKPEAASPTQLEGDPV